MLESLLWKREENKRLGHCFLPDSHASLTKLLHRLAWFNTWFWAANHPAVSANQSTTTVAANQSATINTICVRNQKSGCHVFLTLDIHSNGGNRVGNGVHVFSCDTICIMELYPVCLFIKSLSIIMLLMFFIHVCFLISEPLVASCIALRGMIQAHCLTWNEHSNRKKTVISLLWKGVFTESLHKFCIVWLKWAFFQSICVFWFCFRTLAIYAVSIFFNLTQH